MYISYHDVNVVATITELSRIKNLDLSYIGRDEVDEKVQVEFEVEVDGVQGNVYSWKEYRTINRREQIEFHIGARDWRESMVIKEYIVRELGKL